MKILVTGSSGLVGTAVVKYLENTGIQVTKLIRQGNSPRENSLFWNPISGDINLEKLEGFDAVVNLAGDNVASRWAPKKKKKIWDSRVLGTQNLCQALAQLKVPPKVLINASAIGYYGDSGDSPVDESSPAGHSFLSSVCKDWERATTSAEDKGIRVVKLRIGIVLSKDGGLLRQILTPFKLGFGGKIGSGKQYMSWIALEDLVTLIKYCIENPQIDGPVNAVTSNSVTNQEFTSVLGKALHRPTFIPLPAFVVRVVFGEMGEELMLQSQHVIPKKLQQYGFQFKYDDLQSAISEILKNN